MTFARRDKTRRINLTRLRSTAVERSLKRSFHCPSCRPVSGGKCGARSPRLALKTGQHHHREASIAPPYSPVTYIFSEVEMEIYLSRISGDTASVGFSIFAARTFSAAVLLHDSLHMYSSVFECFGRVTRSETSARIPR